MSKLRPAPVACALALAFLSAPFGFAADTASSLPPPPAPVGMPQPGPKNDAPYVPQPIVPGGVIIPLYPPDSPHLNQEKIREPEVYQFWGPHQLGAIVSIHNPSIEFHRGNGQVNTGACIILAAGGGHNSLNVGSEAAPFVGFFAHHGINTVILRNRLRSDGYQPRVDAARDALQAVKLVRAHAQDWNLDPAKIGLMGFSAGGELAAHASIFWEEFDRTNDVADNPLAKTSSRPDFTALIYTGPTPFARGGTPPIPRACPPAFIAGPSWGGWIHGVWATEYFTALHRDGVPNVEIHLYARGKHPGDKVGPDEPPATGGLANNGLAFATWSERFLDWFGDLGFTGKPGVPTQAAKDVAAHLDRQPRNLAPSAPRPAPATPANVSPPVNG